MTNPPILWEGKELRTMGETMEAVIAIAEAGDRQRADAFIEAYEKIAEPKVVRANIGFGAGYYDQTMATKIFDVFQVRHPVFGKTFPNPDWAFELGQRRATGGRPPKKMP